MVKDTPGRAAGTVSHEGGYGSCTREVAIPVGPALPLAVPQVGCSPRQPRRCLRSGQGSPPCRGGTVTWRLRALLPTPHRELHPLHGPQGPTAQPTAAGRPGERSGKREVQWQGRWKEESRAGAAQGTGRREKGDRGSPSPPSPGQGLPRQRSGIVQRFRRP